MIAELTRVAGSDSGAVLVMEDRTYPGSVIGNGDLNFSGRFSDISVVARTTTASQGPAGVPG